MKLHDLPDDILIPTFSLLTLPSLFSLRLTCRSTRAVVDTYISTIAPAVARVTFPRCDALLKIQTHQPEANDHGSKKKCDLKWLKSLVPAHLAGIALDKDKLRPYPYMYAGFPYGIPCQSQCAEAVYWRGRVAKGWCVLRRLYVISRDVYSMGVEDGDRSKVWRKVSRGTGRVWRTVSCPYQGCEEHGMRRMFERRRGSSVDCGDGVGHGMSAGDEKRRSSESETSEDFRRCESVILKRRLAYINTLQDEELMDYLYLWRLLYWALRPYRKPDTTFDECVNGWREEKGDEQIPTANWTAMTRDVLLGCSWLNWYILHIGTTPFLQQWWPAATNPKPTSKTTSNPSLSSNMNASNTNTNTLRNQIWTAHQFVTPHTLALTRHYISKFEFALRKRCLTPERLSRLESEIHNGRVVKTISLQCIPWAYDQHFITNRPPEDFPWYGEGERVWMDGDLWYVTKEGEKRGRVWRRCGFFERRGQQQRDREEGGRKWAAKERDPLNQVPYLIYLGADAETV